ncbi:hypothetical protein EJB05_18941, partial [Eragrostis curvula]
LGFSFTQLEMAHHILGHHHHKAAESGPAKITDWRKQEKPHKHMEQLGQIGAVAAGAYAMVRPREAPGEEDPGHAHSHKIKEGVAAAVAVGSAGFAFHEHHQKKDAKKHRSHGHHH